MISIFSRPDQNLVIFTGECPEIEFFTGTDLLDQSNIPMFPDIRFFVSDTTIQSVGDTMGIFGCTFTVASGASTGTTWDGTELDPEQHAANLVEMLQKNRKFCDFNITYELKLDGTVLIAITYPCYETISDLSFDDSSLPNPYGANVDQGTRGKYLNDWVLLVDIFCDGVKQGKTIIRSPKLPKDQFYHHPIIVDISKELDAITSCTPSPSLASKQVYMLPKKTVTIKYGSRWVDDDGNLVYGDYCDVGTYLAHKGEIPQYWNREYSYYRSSALSDVFNPLLVYYNGVTRPKEICKSEYFWLYFCSSYVNNALNAVVSNVITSQSIALDILFYDENGNFISIYTSPSIINGVTDGLLCVPFGIKNMVDDSPVPENACFIVPQFVSTFTFEDGSTFDAFSHASFIRFKHNRCCKCSPDCQLIFLNNLNAWESFGLFSKVSKSIEYTSETYCIDYKRTGLIDSGNGNTYYENFEGGDREFNNTISDIITLESDWLERDEYYEELIRAFVSSKQKILIENRSRFANTDQDIKRGVVLVPSTIVTRVENSKTKISFSLRYSSSYPVI